MTERSSSLPLPEIGIRSSVVVSVLELRNIQFRSLKDFNYSHRSGEKALILGVSGCGKSSLLQLISGQAIANSGSLNNNFSTIGHIYQDLNLMSHLSAYENAEIILPSKSELKKFTDFLGQLKMPKLDTLVSQLSQGEQQRVAIALALSEPASLLLADEPTSHLDPSSALLALELIIANSDSLLLVSHDHRFKNYFSKTLEIGGQP